MAWITDHSKNKLFWTIWKPNSSLFRSPMQLTIKLTSETYLERLLDMSSWLLLLFVAALSKPVTLSRDRLALTLPPPLLSSRLGGLFFRDSDFFRAAAATANRLGLLARVFLSRFRDLLFSWSVETLRDWDRFLPRLEDDRDFFLLSLLSRDLGRLRDRVLTSRRFRRDLDSTRLPSDNP